MSRDDGVVWEVLPGLDDREPRSLGIDRDGNLLVGTRGSGLFRAPYP
jgi:hypothetical protein